MEERARGAGLTLSERVREVLLSAEPGSWPRRRFAVRVLALRSLSLNLHFRSRQAPLTEAEMSVLIERADGVKMQGVRERLEANRAESRKDAEERRL